jgi:SAM-dependent methyltransferase
MTSMSRNGAERLVGFDSAGEAFIADGRVLRGIYAGHGATYREILEVCEQGRVFDRGIIATRLLPENPIPALNYDIVLEHDLVPFVTYPHEWSATMLKEAALFHLRLFEDLSAYGLTLKDWHPYNILFRGTEPVFVDFTSIIQQDRLKDEAYLNTGSSGRRQSWDDNSAYLYQMYLRMYVPYFLLPLYMMAQGRHSEARERILATALNAAESTIVASEVFAGRPLAWLKYKLAERRKRSMLNQPGQSKSSFFRALRAELETLEVAVGQSGYTSYYAAKNEQVSYEPSDAWSAKQIAVYDTLRRFNPRTLLDIGSNTGWFAVLATKQGASVVALDIDEASIEVLYNQARAEKLDIVPLVLNVADATPDVPARVYPGEPSRSLIGGTTPILRSAQRRLACDTVLALALVHHLVLGRGITVNEVARMLDGYAKHNLVVEFVAIDDALIAAEPGFFPAYAKAPASFAGYTLEAFKSALREYFPTIEVRPSHPSTRTMLLCSK